MTSSMLNRLAIVAAVLFFAGALAATFIPTEAGGGAECNTWVSPEWSEEKVDKLVQKAADVAEQDVTGQFTEELYSMAKNARDNQGACEDALSTRRTITFVLLGGLLIVPAGLIFVGRART